jgi:hypothetical protein
MRIFTDQQFEACSEILIGGLVIHKRFIVIAHCAIVG